MRSLVIDANHLVHRCWHTTQGLRTKGGVASGVVHGFLSSFCHLRKIFEPDYIYACWDRKSRYRRRLLSEYRSRLEKQALEAPTDSAILRILEDTPHNYKESRYKRRTEEEHAIIENELIPQMVGIQYILPHLGVRNLIVHEVEGDDLIGMAADLLSAHGEVVIVSADRDLYQLLGDNVSLYDPIKKRTVTKETFIDKFHVTPDRYPEIKALMGDSGDDIPGVPRIGEKTAIKLIQESQNLPNLISSCEDLKPKSVTKTLPLYEEQIRFAYEMSFIMAHPHELDDDQEGEFWAAWKATVAVNWQEVNTFCETYELQAVRRELHQFLVGQKEEVSLSTCQTLDELFKTWGDCARCLLHKTRIHLVKYGGSPSAKIILCGEGPGAAENIRGEPFAGRAGKFLREHCLRPVGLHWANLHVMNAVCCRPTDGNDNNRPPSKEETEACRPRLINQVRIVNPKLVVLLGDKALKSFFPDSGKISQERGCEPRFHPDFPEVPFVSVYHPSYLMRLRPNHSDRKRSMIDWQEIKRLAESAT